MQSKSDGITLHPFRVISGNIDQWIEGFNFEISKSDILVLVDRNSIHGQRHLLSAVSHALRSISRGENRARIPSIEIIRWLSGSRQVSSALELTAPVNAGTVLLAVIVGEGVAFDNIPDPEIGKWSGCNISGLEPLDIKDTIFGGRSVIDKYGLTDNDDLELQILEMVAMSDL